MLTVEEARAALGVSRATVWRMIQRKELASVRRRGRRLIPEAAVRPAALGPAQLMPISPSHPMARLIGIGNSGGRGPGASAKHAILAEAAMARRITATALASGDRSC
jgi:excisionase family DNA binding protein